MNYVLTFLAGCLAGGVVATLYHVQVQNAENKAKADFASLLALFHKQAPTPAAPASDAPPKP